MSAPRSIFEGWLDVQTKSFMNRRKWQRRYIKIWTRLKDPTEGGKSPEDPDACFCALFTLDDKDSKLAQRYNLRYYCNAKYRRPQLFGEKETPAQYLYVELVTSSDVPQEKAPELIVRADRGDQDQVRAIRLMVLACQEECRSVCPVSARLKQAFDREMFYASAAEAVPVELVKHTQQHLQSFKAPELAGRDRCPDLYSFLLEELENLMESPSLEKAAFHAKMISGFAARVARQMWGLDKPEGKKAHEGPEGMLEALSEYQLRQLVEICIYTAHGVSDMGRLHRWAVAAPQVSEMGRLIQGWQTHCGGSGAKMLQEMLETIPAPWFLRLQAKHPDCYVQVQDTVGMLTPALEMVTAMLKCSTTVQKVRLWAEAILEAISLINMQLGAEHGQGHLGGDDIPSVVLFLTCLNDMFECSLLDFVAQVSLAQLFCIDNYGNDYRKFGLPPAGLWEDLANQYAFHAEQRGIDHSHYLLWVEDTLQLISETAKAQAPPSPSQPAPPEHPAAAEEQSAAAEEQSAAAEEQSAAAEEQPAEEHSAAPGEEEPLAAEAPAEGTQEGAEQHPVPQEGGAGEEPSDR